MARTKRRFKFYTISASRRGRKIRRVIRTTLSLTQLRKKFLTMSARRNLKNVIIRRIKKSTAIRLVKQRPPKSRRSFRFTSGEGFRL